MSTTSLTRRQAMAEWCTCGVPLAGDCPRHDLDDLAPRTPERPDVGERYRLSLEGDPRWVGYAAQFPQTQPAPAAGEE